MSGQPWYKRYPKDFIMGSLGMTLEEKGAYSMLLDLIYEHGKPIADEPRYISGVLGCSVKKWKTIREKLISLEKITVENGVISNFRANLELENSAKLHSKLVENGAKGGKKTAKKLQEPSKNNDVDKAPLKPTCATQKPDTEKKEVKEDKSSSPSQRAQKIGLQDLSVYHIADWLAKKRSEGKYLSHDETFIVEYFKNYCESKGKRYDDYVAALRNAFEWDLCQPRGGSNANTGGKATGNPVGAHAGSNGGKVTWASEADRVAAKYLAKAEAEKRDEQRGQSATVLLPEPSMRSAAALRQNGGGTGGNG